jgi:hypothetical protein
MQVLDFYSIFFMHLAVGWPLLTPREFDLEVIC